MAHHEYILPIMGSESLSLRSAIRVRYLKEYFFNFYAINNDISIDLSTGDKTIHDGKQPDWKVHLIDTGFHTPNRWATQEAGKLD